MSELFINHLSVRFNGTPEPILEIPDLVIRSGLQVAVSGVSGSGKTTLVNAISGLERCARGQVFWDGIDIGAYSESKLDRWRATNVGLVMQDFHLYPGLSALDNVLLPLKFYHWRLPAALKIKAKALLARLGVEHNGTSVDLLSRGEKQRVAIARALLQSPPIIIADEPTASLDAENGMQVIKLLTRLASESKATLICITHDLRLSQTVRRHILLDAGRPIQDSTVGKRL
ncbi:ABC transporter ATP-binding protein [Budvicia diplopodorum]|uniref:ABC transporter ATP-binding protein n=1 Tax=Budvicia diplopodorum TaxID=1119056 RepID=UPI001356BDCD|nr:ATP-binding cassette domain-containing protein [Budvicia diplopodorum]